MISDGILYEFDENIKIHEDSHYLYRIFRDNPKCGVISDATYWHRIRSNGTSATQTIKHKENVFNMSGYLLKDLLDFYLCLLTSAVRLSCKHPLNRWPSSEP